MELNGKKTERFWLPAQVRTDDAVSAEIRLSQQEDGRSRLQDQISFLLMMGLEYRRLLISNGNWQPRARALSQGSTLNFRHEETANTGAHKSSQASTSAQKAELPNQLLLPNTGGPIPARKKRTA